VSWIGVASSGPSWNERVHPSLFVINRRRHATVTAIETRGLTRYYGDLCAVDHLDLSVERGELYAFLGPNGAGKTTTIRMLIGLIRPSAGQAWLDGLDLAANPLAVKARVGVVPQRSNLYGELTARDNLIFMAKLYGLPRREWRRRADELLSEFELTERAETPFAALSGGMKRRLTIAAALVHRPAILFLDEPTTGLDVQASRGLRRVIADLRSQGVTIFLTTHLIHEAELLADRVAIVVKGQLVAVDTPTALRQRCQSETLLELDVPTADQALLAGLQESTAIQRATRSGEHITLVADSVEAGLQAALDVLRAQGLNLRGARSVTPTLEDAFVQLTDLDPEAMRNGANNGRAGGQA
jgi:ABC-2 type transport system ATP-binding protein